MPHDLPNFDPWEPPQPAGTKRKRPRRHVENDDYMAFVGRIIKAGRKRIATADPEDLARWVALRNELDDAIGDAVRAQQAAGFSWAEIARPLGITKQAAFKRWGKIK